MRRICIYFLLLFFSVHVYGGNGYKVVWYTANEGLPSTLVYRLFQDSRDFLWIGSKSGLTRFDGKRFQTFSSVDGLYGDFVAGLDEDKKGHLWIGTPVGLSRYDGRKFNLEAAFTSSMNTVACIGDEVWIGTKNGLYIYKKHKLTYCDTRTGLPSSKISCFLRSKNGVVLVGTGRGIAIYKGKGRFETLWPATDTEGYVMDMAEDKDCRIWFCTLNGSIFYLYKDKLYRPSFDSAFSFPRSICVDGNRTFFTHDQHITVFENGVFKETMEGFLDAKNARLGMLQTVIDREGTFWSTSTFGLVSFKASNIETYTLPKDIYDAEDRYPERYDKTIESMFRLPEDTCIYIANTNGVYQFCSDSIVRVFRDKPRQGGDISMFDRAGDGTYFFGSMLNFGFDKLNNLLSYKDGKYSVWPQQESALTSIHIDDELWIGAIGKVSVYKNGLFKNYKINEDSIKYRVLTMSPYDGGLLLGTQLGLLYFKQGSFRVMPVPGTRTPPTIVDIFNCKDNTYLLSTRGNGLLHIRVKNNKVEVIRSLSTKNGLNSNFLHAAVLFDKTVWVTALNGVYRIRDFFTDPDIEYLNRDDGLLANNWDAGPMVTDEKGYIYIGGSEGLMKFHSSIDLGNSKFQKTYITSVKVNNTDFQWPIADSLIPFSGVPEQYEFKPDQNSLTFYFTSVNLHKASRTKYEYALLGYSDKKIVTGIDYVTFNNLPSGTYVLKVRSTANQMFTTEPYATFSFEILTPFWNTWWFRSVVLIIITTVIYAIYRWRFAEQMKKQQKEIEVHKQITETKILAFQARMNPHFIFNSLNSIQYFITNNDKLATLNYLSKFARLLRQILDNTAGSRITLEKEIEMLRSYIEMEELRFEHRFRYEITVDPSISPSDAMIPGMVIQPFVENAILHGLLHKAETGLLKIHFKTNGRQIICTVEDNGVGRSHSRAVNEKKITQHKSHGTAIAINRLQLHNDEEKGLNNNVIFEDLVWNGTPSGTKVIIYIPIL